MKPVPRQLKDLGRFPSKTPKPALTREQAIDYDYGKILPAAR